MFNFSGVISSHFYRFKLRILFAPPSFFQVTCWFLKWRSLKPRNGHLWVLTRSRLEEPIILSFPTQSNYQWPPGRLSQKWHGMPRRPTGMGLLIRAILTFGDILGVPISLELTATSPLKMGLQLPTGKKNRLPTLPFFQGVALILCFVGGLKLVYLSWPGNVFYRNKFWR